MFFGEMWQDFKRGIVFFLLSLLLGLVYLLFFYFPSEKRLQQLKMEEAVSQETVQRLVMEKKGLEKALKEQKRLEEQYYTYSLLLPQKINVPNILENFFNIGERNRVKLTAIVPSAEKKKTSSSADGVKKLIEGMDFQVTAKGNFDGLMHTLLSFEEAKPLVAVKEVNINKAEEESGQASNLTMQISLSTFQYDWSGVSGGQK